MTRLVVGGGARFGRALLLVLVVGSVLAAPGVAAAPGASIWTFAGTGIDGSSGDGGPATRASINHPRGIAITLDGGYLFAEPFNHTVRRVAPDGTITTVAGTGSRGFSGDGGAATEARLNLPHGVVVRADGGFYIDDTLNHVIRIVSPEGTISTFAGTGVPGFSGDGGPAAQARIDAPRGIAAAPDGGLLIADTDNDRIRRVWPDGTITTVAGTGVRGFGGDGGPATAAQLNAPFAVASLPDGSILIADNGNNRIRLISPDGTIATVAGAGLGGYSGDGGAATQAQIDRPHAVLFAPDGGFFIADTPNNRVRRVWPDGTITTAAGTGAAGFGGEGGPAVEATLNAPKALALAPDGGLLVGDAENHRVRYVAASVRLVMSAAKLTPAAPKAGKRLQAQTRVSITHAGPLPLGEIGCSARTGRQRLAVVKRSLVGGLATCVWKVPAGAGGKVMRGRVTVSSGPASASRSLSARVRSRGLM